MKLWHRISFSICSAWKVRFESTNDNNWMIGIFRNIRLSYEEVSAFGLPNLNILTPENWQQWPVRLKMQKMEWWFTLSVRYGGNFLKNPTPYEQQAISIRTPLKKEYYFGINFKEKRSSTFRLKAPSFLGLSLERHFTSCAQKSNASIFYIL